MASRVERMERLGRWREALVRLGTRTANRFFELTNRLRLPGPVVLPVTGALVGFYAGLAAGIFANLIGVVTGVVAGAHAVLVGSEVPRELLADVTRGLARARWHPEFAVTGIPAGAAALLLARFIPPGGDRNLVRRRLRVLALLLLGALALYYPLVALSALSRALSSGHELIDSIPVWVVLLVPPLGGVMVGRLLRDRPELHGHGVPEVVRAVEHEAPLRARGGLLKLVASAVTIGTGGSAGREGPIVYGGAAFASSVGRTLGFTRKELTVLLASGAGAGIAASFNAPIAGAIFAMEIILREFELRVLSPIILASVTATMVGRGLMGSAPMLRRIPYQLVSGWELFAYVALGLLCGLLGYAFARLLHRTEALFHGQLNNALSRRLGKLPLWARAGIGGLLVGAMAVASPTVWGTGHAYSNLASAGQLGLQFLVVACALKLVATAVTIGSGGSGGTFFPATVIGAMGGGAFGTLVHTLLPATTAPSGAYALVGMGGVVAAITRGPLTGMMMLYELTANYAIILPLMVTCAIASAMCHLLLERRQGRVLTQLEVLRRTAISEVMHAATPLDAKCSVADALEPLLRSVGGVLPVTSQGLYAGVIELDELRDLVTPEQRNAQPISARVRPLRSLSPADRLADALERMDQHNVDALAVNTTEGAYAVVTRRAIRRFLRERHRKDTGPHGAVVAAELERAPPGNLG